MIDAMLFVFGVGVGAFFAAVCLTRWRWRP